MSITNYWIESVKKLVKQPTEFFDQVEERGNLQFALSFAAISGAVGAFLSGVIASTGYLGEPLAILFILLLAPILGLIVGVIGLLINAGLIHIAVYLFGERGFTRTSEAVTYATAANALLAWIPFLGPLLAFIAVIFLEVKGLKQFHNLSTGKALIAAFFPIILGFVAIVAITALFLGGMTALMGTTA